VTCWAARDRARTLTRIRNLCLALPEVSERLSHGAPAKLVEQMTRVD
jgi:hypothetical protein